MRVAAVYGPNTALVAEALARARRLDEREGLALLDANRRLVVPNQRLSAALRDVVYAAYRSDRTDEMERAQRAGRNAVGLFAPSRRQVALAGIVGRMCETLVVLELLPPETREVLLAPWHTVIDEHLGAAVRSPSGM